MLTDVTEGQFTHFFNKVKNPFISEGFIELNSHKVEQVLRITEESNKPGLGLIAGRRNGRLISPFSAPFGGFHYKKENIHIGEIEDFLNTLKSYLPEKNIEGLEIVLPPDIYHQSFNAKLVSALLRSGYQQQVPDITNWVVLNDFEGKFTQKNSKEYYKQALKNELTFNVVESIQEKEATYDLVRENRARFGRPIFMSFEDIENTGKLWPVDYFMVRDKNGDPVASAIMYRSHPDIVYALFWGDNEAGRPLRAMDYLAFHLWTYYKDRDFSYVDLGISTEGGIPNEGLLRFKESHEAVSSLRYKFSIDFNA